MGSNLRAGWPFAVIAALALLLVLGVLTFAGPCMHDDGTHGACFDASRAVLAAGVAAVVVAVLGLLVRNANVKGLLAVACALLGAFAAAGPGGLFPLCMVQTMRCWTIMRPFAMVVGILLAAFAVVAAVMALRRRAGRAS